MTLFRIKSRINRCRPSIVPADLSVCLRLGPPSRDPSEGRRPIFNLLANPMRWELLAGKSNFCHRLQLDSHWESSRSGHWIQCPIPPADVDAEFVADFRLTTRRRFSAAFVASGSRISGRIWPHSSPSSSSATHLARAQIHIQSSAPSTATCFRPDRPSTRVAPSEGGDTRRSQVVVCGWGEKSA